MKKSVVLVEDNTMYRELLSWHLNRHGDLKVTAFASAEDCLAQLEHVPDAYILDQELAPADSDALNGYQLFRTLQKIGKNAPALFLTSHPRPQPAVEIMKSGAFQYLRKETHDLDKVVGKLREMWTWQSSKQEEASLTRLQSRQVFGSMVFVGLLAALSALVFFL